MKLNNSAESPEPNEGQQGFSLIATQLRTLLECVKPLLTMTGPGNGFRLGLRSLFLLGP